LDERKREEDEVKMITWATTTQAGGKDRGYAE